jgi:hypothetical protein
MSDNIAFLSLVHLLVKKGILLPDEAKDLHGIAYLKSILETKGVLKDVDLQAVSNGYEGIVKLVRGYLSTEDKGQRGEILLGIEKVLSEDM